MTDDGKTREQLILELAESQRRVAELELRERRYRTIIETVPLAIVEIDREGVITFVNTATEGVSGYRPEEFVGKVAWDDMEGDPERDRFPSTVSADHVGAAIAKAARTDSLQEGRTAG